MRAKSSLTNLSSTFVFQNLNLISDYKFGFYMKIPEKEMFIGQVWGTLLGPFINYGVMRVIIDEIGVDVLTGVVKSESWLALKTRNFYRYENATVVCLKICCIS